MTVEFLGEICLLTKDHYLENHRKQLALRIAKTGEPMAVCTVNIVDCDCPDDEVFIKGYSENIGMEQALIDAGVIYSKPTTVAVSQNVSVNRYKLTIDALKLFGVFPSEPEYKPRTKQEVLNAYDLGYPKFEWFILFYFGQKAVDTLKKAREDENITSMMSILVDVWFKLPDSQFNIIESPKGWHEFLNVIEE